MLCSSWCVSFDIETKLENVYNATVLVKDASHYQICNRRESNIFDGEGTPQIAKLQLDKKIKIILKHQLNLKFYVMDFMLKKVKESLIIFLNMAIYIKLLPQEDQKILKLCMKLLNAGLVMYAK